ncbi:serine/threonine protein kinase [Bradymonadaceae bacterium TMQ3]|nr:serine/threonine protein kinase [Bradymonadaceae bacterium TMQ3]TXC78071.1 protein kinase [Bradymonadales bacterium TMQ1]
MSQDDAQNPRPRRDTSPVHDDPARDSSPLTMPSDRPREIAAGEARQIVKICKSCMVSQKSGGGYCVKCGAPLVPIRAVKDSCIGDVVGGKFKIIEPIGSGGMGDVYLGLNEKLGQRVAVKFLNQKFTSDERIVLRFLNEARSYCKVNHPNAVTLLEYGQHENGALYLITEFIDGKSLTEVLRAQGPLERENVVSIGLQVCEVLRAAHAQGVIHRDLKPDNLMLMPARKGRFAVKVLDFGIAKIADDDDAPMTETGSIFGTPEFMSPEQARGDVADPRSDLYALGVMLFFMATGKLPFKGKNKFAILNKQLHDAPPLPSLVRQGVEVDENLEAVILRCLAKDPAERPADAEALAELLESVEAGERVAVPQGAREAGRTAALKRQAAEAQGLAEASEGSQSADLLDEDVSSPKISGELHLESGPVGPVEMRLDSDPIPVFRAELTSEPDIEGEEAFAFGGTEAPWPPRRRNRQRSPALVAALSTVAVVGLAMGWSVWRNTQAPADVVTQASAEVGNGQWAGIEAAVGYLIEAGQIEEARQALAAAASDDVRAAALETRINRVANLERQLGAALGARQCEQAREHYEALLAHAPGAATSKFEAVEACGKTSAKAPAAVRPRPRPPQSPDRQPQQEVSKPPVERAPEPEVPVLPAEEHSPEAPLDASPVDEAPVDDAPVDAVPIEAPAGSDVPVDETPDPRSDDAGEPPEDSDSAHESAEHEGQAADEVESTSSDDEDADTGVSEDGMALPPRQL